MPLDPLPELLPPFFLPSELSSSSVSSTDIYSSSLPPPVANCFPWGIGPMSWFCDKFNTAKNVKLVNCAGISPMNLFEERSNDSIVDKFANDGEIWPVKLL